MPRQYSVQFRDRVLGLVEKDRDVGELASELGISPATIYRWRQEARVDAEGVAGVNSAVPAELADAKRRIREVEEELAATQFAATVLREGIAVSVKRLRSRDIKSKGFSLSLWRTIRGLPLPLPRLTLGAGAVGSQAKLSERKLKLWK